MAEFCDTLGANNAAAMHYEREYVANPTSQNLYYVLDRFIISENHDKVIKYADKIFASSDYNAIIATLNNYGANQAKTRYDYVNWTNEDNRIKCAYTMALLKTGKTERAKTELTKWLSLPLDASYREQPNTAFFAFVATANADDTTKSLFKAYYDEIALVYDKDNTSLQELDFLIYASSYFDDGARDYIDAFNEMADGMGLLLQKLSESRNLNRTKAGKSGKARVCIVGYTNSGKSTLLNTISKAGVTAEDKLFATLDPKTVNVYIDGTHILLTDTVGFINKLPHEFIRAFESTLDEAKYADLLLHVVDISNPNYIKQIEVVNGVLSKIGADKIPVLMVYNKSDVNQTFDSKEGVIISARKNKANENKPINFIEEDIIKSAAAGQKIITRFPPEPNGYMHIGHAKACCINFSLAKKYGGYTNLRMDDTNPAKESIEYAENLAADVRWLGLEYKQLLFASDYYEKIYQCAVTLIKKGLAYVDDQTSYQISETRGDLTTPGKKSPWHDRSAEENLKLFTDMRAGKFADGEKVLRAKIDMNSPNMNMRDPVIYRIAREYHYRTGDNWCVYPMYDFAHPLSDAFENISHSCCSLEFEDHRPLYDWCVLHCLAKDDSTPLNGYELRLKNDGKNYLPRQFEFSRLNIEQTVMSKRWLKRFVDEKLVEGWDDPRMPTISGMRRRGYPAQAICDFVLSVGVNKSYQCVPLSALEFYVRSALDPVVARAAVCFNPIKVVITNYKGGSEELEIANNPHDESKGKHKIYFSRDIYIDGGDFSENPPPKYKRLTVGGTVRLRGAYIIKCDKVIKNGNNIEYLECTYFENSRSGADTSGIKPNGVIHFVEAVSSVAATVNEYFPLLKNGTDLTEENLTDITKVSHSVVCEKFLGASKPGDKFQFVRNGFYCCDKESTATKLIFNKTVGLKEGY
ncbi:glutamine-trna ligase [Holotrichia oblita]|nr:glutamine-trna ligase [Holotrichia oblita]